MRSVTDVGDDREKGAILVPVQQGKSVGNRPLLSEWASVPQTPTFQKDKSVASKSSSCCQVAVSRKQDGPIKAAMRDLHVSVSVTELLGLKSLPFHSTNAGIFVHDEPTFRRNDGYANEM